MEQKNTHYYDLDGTLSSLNSTIDFVEGYLKFRKKFVRLFIAKSISKFMVVTRTYHPYKSRTLLLYIFFFGLVKQDLEKYFEEVYKEKFMSSLTSLGNKLLQNPETADIMLTGCTEIPARMIGDIFGFKQVISTEFFYSKGRIQGINSDTYGNLKANFLEKSNGYRTYYTDDLKSESSLIGIMNNIIEV